MEEIDLVAESVIEVEEIKEERMDKKEDCCWNSIVKDEPSALLHSIKEEVDKDDELEPPFTVFVQPVEKQEGACIEETKMENWSVEKILQFIAEVEGHRCLWDVNSPDYKNKLMKGNSRNSVASKFLVTPSEAARKLKNLRTQFSHELKRMQKPGPSGSGYCKASKWAYFEPMKFMEGSIMKRPSLNTTGQSTADVAEVSDNPTPTPTPTQTTTPTVKRKRGPTQEMIEKAQAILNSGNDECQIFGDYIAMELRKLEEKHRTELKRRVLVNLLEVQEQQKKDSEHGSSTLSEV